MDMNDVWNAQVHDMSLIDILLPRSYQNSAKDCKASQQRTLFHNFF